MANAQARIEIQGLEEVIPLKMPPSVSLENVGDTATVVVTDAQSMQARDYDTRDLKVWNDGRPIMVLVVFGEVDGESRTVWFDNREKRDALKAGLYAAGLSGIAVGDTFTIAYADSKPTIDKKTGKPSKSLSATKVYSIEFLMD